MENDNINVVKERKKKNEFNKITDFISKNSTSYCKIHENDAFLSSSCKFYIYPAVDINNENMASNRHLDLHKDLDFKDWDLICLVDYYTNELTPCPICLDDLVAPRITRCGHIFCTVCIYNLNDFNFGNYFTCPVCYTLINVNNCKIVNIIFKHSYKDNDFIEFDLIVADDQYSIFYNENKLEMYRNHKFCNLNYFLNILNNHLSELNMCTENNKIQKTEYVFFRKVKNEICQLIENYCKLNWKSISDRQKHQDLYIRENYFTDNLRVFYKSSDEQNIYLDKLEVNMIKCQFNSFFDYPKIISVNINRLKTYLLTKKNKEIFKYLFWKQENIEFKIAQVNLYESKIVSLDTYYNFTDEIKKRNERFELYKKQCMKIEDNIADKILQKSENSQYPYMESNYVMETPFLYNKDDFIPLPNCDKPFKLPEHLKKKSFIQAISESLDENSKNLNNLEIIRKKCENVENENELEDEIDKKSIV